MGFIRFAETETSLFFEKYTHLGRKIPNLQNHKNTKKSTFDHFDHNARVDIKNGEMSGDLTYDIQKKNENFLQNTKIDRQKHFEDKNEKTNMRKPREIPQLTCEIDEKNVKKSLLYSFL